MFRFSFVVFLLTAQSAFGQAVNKSQCEKALTLLEAEVTTTTKLVREHEQKDIPILKDLARQNDYMGRAISKYSGSQKAYLEAAKNYRNATQDLAREIELCAR